MKNFAVLLITSAALTGLMQLVGLPASVMLGSMLGGIALASSGRTVPLPRWVLTFAQAVLGAMLARMLTPQLFVTLSQHVVAFVCVVGAVVGVAVVIGVVLSRLGVVPGSVALWGSFPGAASMMVLMADAHGVDSRLVAFMQYLRVALVTLAASAVARLAGATVATSTEPVFAPVDWSRLALTVLVMAASVYLAARARLRAGPMLATMTVMTALQNFGGLHIELPRWLLMTAWCALGWAIGLRFTRDILVHVGRAFPRVLLGVLVLLAACAAMGFAVGHLMHLDVLSSYFATSPGGADVIAILASNADVAVSLVMAIQLGRTVVVLLVGPRLVTWLAPRLERAPVGVFTPAAPP